MFRIPLSCADVETVETLGPRWVLKLNPGLYFEINGYHYVSNFNKPSSWVVPRQPREIG